MDEAIMSHLRRSYNLLIGEQTAEETKIQIGSAYPLEEEMEADVKGRDLVGGVPRTLKITSEEIREALQEPISAIVEALKLSLEETPPELAADLVDRGIVMTGGGSLLRGLDVLLREETKLPINVVENPLTCVVLGTGKILENLAHYEPVLMRSAKR